MRTIGRLSSLILILGIALTGCNGDASKSNTEIPLTKIRLPMGYIPSVQYAPFYVAVQNGYFRQAGLEIEFDSLKVKGIHKPEELKGKKIGLPGLFGASYIGLRAFLNAGGLDEGDVILDSIGFNQVEALVSGRDDAVVVYVNNEPIQLESKGYPVDIIRVADYVSLASNGMLTNETTIATQPQLVRSMVQAVLKGVAYTLDHPDAAFEISKNFVEGLDQGDQEVQKKILATSMGFWKTNRPGYSQPQAWENMQTVLLDMGMLRKPLDLSKAYTNDFVGEK
jgi:NitT/TauT family transport system substrate-binding protein